MHFSPVSPAPGPAAVHATAHNPPGSSEQFCGHRVSATEKELMKFDDPLHIPVKVQIFAENPFTNEREEGIIFSTRGQTRNRKIRRWMIADRNIKPVLNKLIDNPMAEGNIRGYFENGLGQVLECHDDNPNSRSERYRSYINLPKDPVDYIWRKELGPHSNEDALIEIFGENNAQHLRDQLNRMQANNPDDKRVKQWIEICDMFRDNKTCSFPYYATRLCSCPYYVEPEYGWRHHNGYIENIVLDLVFYNVDRTSVETINARKNEISNFLESEGVTGNVLWGRVPYPWDSPPPPGRNCLTLGQVFIGELQIFLKTTQVQQLSEALWQFVENSRDPAEPAPELNPDFVPREPFPPRRVVLDP